MPARVKSRYFKRKPKGAGYELEKTLMLTSTDTWFRPSDCCVAPDGSVFVSDWYDPGVGGHNVQDTTRGRIFRLTPTGHKGYKVPELKLDTKEDFFKAFSSSNLCLRALANSSIDKEQETWIWDCVEVTKVDDRLNAKSILYATSSFKEPVIRPILRASSNAKESTRVVAIRSLMLYKPEKIFSVLEPPDVDVLIQVSGQPGHRELLLALGRLNSLTVNTRDEKPHDALSISNLLFKLAKLYDGEDIFYRAALNIACGTDPVRRDAILKDFDKQFPEWNDKVADLVWELRPKSMLPKLETLMSDAKLSDKQKGRIVDILAVYDSADAGKTMIALLSSGANAEVKNRAMENLKLFLPTKWSSLQKGGEMDGIIAKLLQADASKQAGLSLVAAISHTKSIPDVVKIANDFQQPKDVQFEAFRTLGKLATPESVKGLLKALDAAPTKMHTYAAVQALALPLGRQLTPAAKLALDTLTVIAQSKEPDTDIRTAAIEGLAGSYAGTEWLLQAKEKKQLPEDAVATTGRLLRNSPFQLLRNKAMIAFPAPGKLDPKNLPPIAELAKRKGNADNGKSIMMKSMTGETQCMKCHMIRGQGGQIGPDLSMIGKKGSRENLIESMLYPSKAIADQYLSWKLDTEDGQSITGLLIQETETKLTIRDANGKDYNFPVKGTEKKKQLISIMPEGLIATLNEDQLIDLVEYMMTLQTASLTPDYWHIAGPFPNKIDQDFGPEKGAFDIGAKFKAEGKELGWKMLKPTGNGYFDLAAQHGNAGANSLSYMLRTIESPIDQDATILLGADDGCRVFVNGEKVFGHDRELAAIPGKDSIKVKLKKGANTILLKINNGSNPHGFYFSMTSDQELKAK